MKNRANLNMFVAAIAISSLGDWLNILALMSSFVDTHGARAVATLFTCRTIPGILIGLLLSKWVAKLPLKTTLCTLPILQAVVVSWLAYDGAHQFHAALVAAAVLSSMNSISSALVRGAIPHLANTDALAQVNARISMVQTLGYVGMPALAGLVVSTLGIRGAFVADIASFVAFAFLMSTVSFGKSGEPATTTSSHNNEVHRGAWKTLCSSRKLILVAMGVFLASTSLGTIHATEISFFKSVFGVPGAKYGLFVSIAGFGAFIGAWMTGKIPSHEQQQTKLFTLGITLLGAATVLFALSANLYLASALLFISGWSEGFYGVLSSTIIQNTLGKHATAVFTFIGGVSSSGLFLGRMFSVVAVEWLQPSTTLLVAGALSASLLVVFPMFDTLYQSLCGSRHTRSY
jgi:predicted MFS family arabinose efflux permease